MRPCGARCHCRVARVAATGTTINRLTLQEPHASVCDLRCSRMPALALCSGGQRVPRRPSVASTESRTRHRPLRPLLAGGSPRR